MLSAYIAEDMVVAVSAVIRESVARVIFFM
jgi:hypothetical protein